MLAHAVFTQQGFNDTLARRRVDSSQWLIHQHDRTRAGEGGDDFESCPLTIGQSADLAVGLQAHQLEQLSGFLRLPVRIKRGDKIELLSHLHPVVEGADFGQVRDHTPRLGADFHAINEDGALTGPGDSGKYLEQGAFAAAVFPEHTHHPSFVHIQ